MAFAPRHQPKPPPNALPGDTTRAAAVIPTAAHRVHDFIELTVVGRWRQRHGSGSDRPRLETGRLRVASGSPYEARVGFSRAVRVGARVLGAGTAPVWPDGACDPDPGAQARRCLEILVDAFRELGAEPHDVVRTRIYLTDAAHADAVGAAHAEVFGEVLPVATMIVVAALLDERWKVEIEAEAIID